MQHLPVIIIIVVLWLIINKIRWANTLQVIHTVQEQLECWKKNILDNLQTLTHPLTHSSHIMITPPLTSCDEIDKLRSTKKTGYSWNSYTSQDQLVNIFCLFSGIKFIDWIICGLNMTDSVNNWLFHPLMTTTQQLYQKQ